MWLGEPIKGVLEKPTHKNKFTTTSKWTRTRKQFKKGKEDYRGYYQCAHCTNWFKDIETDHIIKRSVAPDKVYDLTNLQLLCHDCHVAKDGGMVVK